MNAPIVKCRARVLAAMLLVPFATGGCATTLERARAANGRGDVDQARELYREAIDEPEHARAARTELAKTYVVEARKQEKRDPDKAEATYRDALEVDPAHDQALTGIVRLLRVSGRIDDAAQLIATAAASGSCAACSRLGVVVLLERGDQAMAAKQWDVAVQHYSEALALRKQPEPALAIARAHAAAGRNDKAIAALGEAAPLVQAGDDSSRKAFFDLRKDFVMAGLAADDVALADRARAVALADEPGSPGVPLEIAVAVHQQKKARNDDAVARYEAMLAAVSSNKITLDDKQAKDVKTRLADLYGLRATGNLAAGKADAANEDLTRALELSPDDWELKLQRVLAVAPKTGSAPALESLDRLPPGTAGVPHVRAILESRRAGELLERGDVDAARAAYEQAQKIHPDMPEVHLAAAQVLSRTVPDELDKREMKALGKRSLVPYDGEIHRYAEALAELAWARSAIQNRPADYPFRAPWFFETAEALEQKIRAIYPYTVEFNAQPEPRLRFSNTGSSTIAIELDGPVDFEDSIEVEAGATTDVTLPDSGLVRMRIDGKKRTFFAESYASVTIKI